MHNSSHILWPYDDEETPERDAFDEADMMYSELSLEKDLLEERSTK